MPFADFVWGWAWVFFVCTTAVALIKGEKPEEEHHQDLGIRETYQLLMRILKLKPILTLVAIHLTNKVRYISLSGGRRVIRLANETRRCKCMTTKIKHLEFALAGGLRSRGRRHGPQARRHRRAQGPDGPPRHPLGSTHPSLPRINVPIFEVPLQILLPWALGRYTAGPKPLSVWLKAYPYRFPALLWPACVLQFERDP